MKQTNMAILAVAIVVVLAGAFYYNYLQTLSTEGQSFLGIGPITINYEDGTSKVYDPPEGGFIGWLKSLQINVGSDTRPISSISFPVTVVADWMGTAQTVTLSGTTGIMVDNTWEIEYAFPTGITITKGATITIYSITIKATDLSTWATTEGEHVLALMPTASLVIKFTDGTSDQKQGEGTTTIKFNKVYWKITQLIVSIQPAQPMY